VSEILRFDWGPAPLPLAMALLLFVLWVVSLRECRLMRRFVILASLWLVIFAATISGRGGGSAQETQQPPPPPALVTPKGNYTIMVTTTANNLPAQAISLSLTVN